MLGEVKAGLAIQGSLVSLETLVIPAEVDQLEELEIKDSKVTRALLERLVPRVEQVGTLR